MGCQNKLLTEFNPKIQLRQQKGASSACKIKQDFDNIQIMMQNIQIIIKIKKRRQRMYGQEQKKKNTQKKKKKEQIKKSVIGSLLSLSHPTTITPLLHLHNKITKQLINCTLPKVGQLYKHISIKLKYILNCIHFQLLQEIERIPFFISVLYTLVKDCIKILHLLVNSTLYQKYGHIYGLFWFVVRKWEEIVGFTVSINSRQHCYLLQRIKQNQQQPQYPNNPSNPNIPTSLPQLLPPTTNKILLSLTQCSKYIQNPQCIGCTRVYTNGQKLIPKNKHQPIIIRLSLKILLLKVQFLKYVYALFNSGGGVILIGGNMGDDGFVVVTGFKVINQVKYGSEQINGKFKGDKQVEGGREFQRTYEKVNEMLEPLRNQANFKVQKVLVRQVSQKYKKKLRRPSRICLRILIQPKHPNKLSFLPTENPEFELYQLYTINKQTLKPKLITELPEQDQIENVYQMIHDQYRQRLNNNRGRNNHQHILCFKPCSSQDYHVRGDGKQSGVQEEDKDGDENQDGELEGQGQKGGQGGQGGQGGHGGSGESGCPDGGCNDYYYVEVADDQNMGDKMESQNVELDHPQQQSYFKYEKISLIVTRSQNQTINAKSFIKLLLTQKHELQLTTPFKQYFCSSNSKMRPISILSHKLSNQQLNLQLQKYEKDNNIAEGSIQILSVERTLQIDCNSLSIGQQKSLRNKYLLKYPQTQLYRLDRDIITYNTSHAPNPNPNPKQKQKQNKNENSKQFKTYQSVFVFTCQNIEQSIFLFMILDEMQIKAYFVKEGEIQKKKVK